MGTDLPVRILRQMPLATCTPAGRQEVRCRAVCLEAGVQLVW